MGSSQLRYIIHTEFRFRMVGLLHKEFCPHALCCENDSLLPIENNL